VVSPTTSLGVNPEAIWPNRASAAHAVGALNIDVHGTENNTFRLCFVRTLKTGEARYGELHLQSVIAFAENVFSADLGLPVTIPYAMVGCGLLHAGE
jgi:hypothetical protein